MEDTIQLRDGNQIPSDGFGVFLLSATRLRVEVPDAIFLKLPHVLVKRHIHSRISAIEFEVSHQRARGSRSISLAGVRGR